MENLETLALLQHAQVFFDLEQLRKLNWNENVKSLNRYYYYYYLLYYGFTNALFIYHLVPIYIEVV